VVAAGPGVREVRQAHGARRGRVRGREPRVRDRLLVTLGGNALFGGSCCPARPGYDLATGWGSPLADTVAGLLGAGG
jgi:hypothetical protein